METLGRSPARATRPSARANRAPAHHHSRPNLNPTSNPASDRGRGVTSSSHPHLRSEDMDESDSDLLMEIVKTPERLPSSSNWRTGFRRTGGCRDSGSNPQDGSDFYFNQARMARNEIANNESCGGSGPLGVGTSGPTRLVAKSGTVISLKPPVKSSKVELSSSSNGYNNESNHRDKGKGIVLNGDSHPRVEQASPGPLQIDAPRGKVGQRRLVRNGCISPSAVAKNKIVEHKDAAAKEGIRNKGVGELPGGISSNPILLSPDSNGRISDGGPHAKDKFRSGRISSASGQGVTVHTYTDGKNVRAEELDRRTVHIPSDTSHDIARKQKCVVNIEHDSPEIIALNHVSNSDSAGATSARGSGNRRALSKGKRKFSQIGECSASSFEDSQINGRRKYQPQGVALRPVIEVDELCSPEAIHSNLQGQTSSSTNESSASVRQLESDEMLARQLQEQLYNESPFARVAEEFGMFDQIDATLAWSLQQQEEAAQHSSNPRQGRGGRGGRGGHRGRSTALSRLRSNSGRSTSRAPLPAPDSISMEARLNYLEAMEAILERHSNPSVSSHILQVHRDFNEDDYEMLLALDENNQHGGASQNQINRLPESVVEADTAQEACAVCLDTPAVGDTIRRLPCLHKFHKECIDTWLKRKKLCPICKSGIS